MSAASSPASVGPPARLVGIDALRGVAALGIVAWHQLGFTVNKPILGHAYKGVGLFFMISGFVMAACYEERLARGLSPWRFGVLRLARLYPLYLTGALLGFALALAGFGLSRVGPGEAWRALPAALVLWPGGLAGDAHLYPLNAPSWSLYLEIAACLAYAFLLPALSTRVLTLATAAGFVLIEAQLARWGNLDGGWSRTTFDVGLARVLYAFPAGVLLFRFWRQEGLPRLILPLWAVCAAFLAVIALPVAPAWDRLLDLGISGVAAPILVILAADARFGPGQARAAQALGAPSYALYALHFPILVAFHVLEPKPGTPGAVVAGATSVALCWLLALAATRWIDQPVRRVLCDYAEGRRPPHVETSLAEEARGRRPGLTWAGPARASPQRLRCPPALRLAESRC